MSLDQDNPSKPSNKWSFSLRQILFLGITLGIVVPALILGVFQVNNRFDTEIDLRVRQPMQQYADMLARGMGMALWNLDRGIATELVDAVLRNPDVVRISITDEYGKDFLTKQGLKKNAKSSLIEERDIMYSGIQTGRLRVELSTDRVENEVWASFIKSALGLFSQLVVSLFVIWYLLDRRVIKPLEALQQGASRLASGDLASKITINTRDEIGELARGMDKMRTDLASIIVERDQKNAALQTELVERQRTEDELFISRAIFATIFDASPVALMVRHMDEGFTIIDANKAWVRLFGRERMSVVGQTGVQFKMWKNPEKRVEIFSTIQAKGEIANFQTWMYKSDETTEILCEISGKVVSTGDKRMLILAFDDVTRNYQYERNILDLNANLEKRVEERTKMLSDAVNQLTFAKTELVRAEKMAALGALVAGVAHELNTPIGNSLTVASTLQDQVNAFSCEVAQGITRSRLDAFVQSNREGTEILMRSMRVAANLVSSFKQVAVDQSSENRRTFLLDATVEEILLTLRPSMRRTSHQLVSTIAQNISMESYPGPLGQVLTNLINNALIHAFEGREGGLVNVDAVLLDQDQVKITVTDNGNGIPSANLPRVFDPFFTTKLGRGGSGLGLNIVYNLVENILGGSIKVESEVGAGACFTIILPLVAPVSAVNNEHNHLPPSAATQR